MNSISRFNSVFVCNGGTLPLSDPSTTRYVVVACCIFVMIVVCCSNLGSGLPQATDVVVFFRNFSPASSPLLWVGPGRETSRVESIFSSGLPQAKIVVGVK